MTGTPSSLTVRVTRKVSDSDFGSFGGEWECTVELGPKANLEEESQALFAFGRAFLGAELVDIQASLKPVAQDAQPPAVVQQDEGLGPKPSETEKPKADKEGDELTFKCLKFTLAKQPDKKFRLELYPEIKDAPGKYPTIKFTAEREKMWAMLEGVADDYDFSDLPVEFACNWLVHYTIGREFEIKAGEHKGEKSHYKDLVFIKGM